MRPVDDDAAAAPSEIRKIERAALLCILDAHPVALTIEELARALDTDDDHATSQRSSIELVVDNLDRLGLLHRSEALISPTRAAVSLDQLLGMQV